MKAEITMSQIWYNHSVMNFFFRTQAERTLKEFLDKVEDTDAALDRIDDYAETMVLTLDDIEEMFYEYQIEDLANEFGIELNEEDQEDEE